jgi:hypothetical protein
MLCALSRWKFWTKSINAVRTFNASTTMQRYKISNFEQQFPHYNKGSTIALQSTLVCNFTLMVKATCETSHKSQNSWGWLRTHCFTIGLSVSVTTLATTHVFPHGALDYNWRFFLW